MQRLFSVFPPGLPGVALLLLRSSVAMALLLEHYGQRQELSAWILVAAIILSVALLVGYLTPIVAVLGLVCHGVIWSAAGVDSQAVATIVFLDAIAVALIGPGAYSVDSYLFGRRVVVVRPP